MHSIINFIARLFRVTESTNVLMISPRPPLASLALPEPPTSLERMTHVVDIANEAGVHLIQVLDLLDDLGMSIGRTGHIEPMLARSVTAMLIVRSNRALVTA